MVNLKIKSMEPETRQFVVEAPDGFVVHVLDPLPEHPHVGDMLGIENGLWKQWKEYWAAGPPPGMALDWFEMADLKKHTFANKVWIPLYADETISETGSAGHVGFRQEYFGAHSVIVPRDQSAVALDLDWMDFFWTIERQTLV